MTNVQRSTSQTRAGTGEFALLACSRRSDSRARRQWGTSKIVLRDSRVEFQEMDDPLGDRFMT